MIKIVYGDVAEGAADGAEYTGTGVQPYSDVSVLSEGADPRFIATGEVGRWKLNGTVDILDDAPSEYGYVSESISDADGNFPEDVGIDIVLDGIYATTGLTVIFDPLEDVTYTVLVTWYLQSEEVSQGEFTGSGEYVIENTVRAYDAVKIRFVKSSYPYRYARLAKIMYGANREFTPYDFQSINITNELNPVSDDLPIDTSNFVLRPVNDIQYIFQTRQTFRIYRGDKLIASHFVKTSRSDAINRYTVGCQSIIGLLEEQTYPDRFVDGVRAVDLAADIIADNYKFTMDEDLKDIVLNGYLQGCTRRKALHQLLFAIGATCTSVIGERIEIFKIPTEAYELSREYVFTGDSVEQDATTTDVVVYSHTLSTTRTDDATEIKIGTITRYDRLNEYREQNDIILTGTPLKAVEIKEATLVDDARAQALLPNLAAYYFGDTTLTQKRVMQGEKLGDRVLAEDLFGKMVDGIIVSKETVVTNLDASTLKVRGKYVS